MKFDFPKEDGMYELTDTQISRVEVIGDEREVIVNGRRPLSLTVSIQDNGRTLKVFVDKKSHL